MSNHIAFSRRARTPGAGRNVFRAECVACAYQGQWHETEYPTAIERSFHERHPVVRISFARTDDPGVGFVGVVLEERAL